MAMMIQSHGLSNASTATSEIGQLPVETTPAARCWPRSADGGGAERAQLLGKRGAYQRPDQRSARGVLRLDDLGLVVNAGDDVAARVGHQHRHGDVRTWQPILDTSAKLADADAGARRHEQRIRRDGAKP